MELSSFPPPLSFLPSPYPWIPSPIPPSHPFFLPALPYGVIKFYDLTSSLYNFLIWDTALATPSFSPATVISFLLRDRGGILIRAPVESPIDFMTELLAPIIKGWYSLEISNVSKASLAYKRVIVEPLIKDTLNGGHNRNNLRIMDKLWCPKYRLPYRASTFLTSEEWTPLYNGQK